MSRSARRFCIFLVVTVAAVTAFLTAGPSPARGGEVERDTSDAEANPNGSPRAEPDCADLVVDLYLV
ncbi:hypothetical protein [Nocardia sp. NPDC005366]|uniref:hypothetical protein n=1 Tax=Nocardia sp. NPDC005366 TaxID=3156878 RepID=UPI0033A80601